jgi:hypothetical protein
MKREETMNKERYILTEEEKVSLLNKYKECYICQKSLEGYDRDEIEFDHIYAFADGYPQDLSNFAPVHASNNPLKLCCHRAKGRKSPIDYREELRIQNKLEQITGLKDLLTKPIETIYSIDEDNMKIKINDKTLPLYNQKIDNKNNYYFFDVIDVKYIGNDEEIQLRPLEAKIFNLIMNLKGNVQLLPSLGRINKGENIIKLFDGQHKAVAQIIGNNKKELMCIVFVDPDITKIREVVYQAHTDFVQQRYKKSHMDAKLADMYKDKISKYREKVGNSEAAYSEYDILQGESKSEITKFIRSSIISELRTESTIIQEYVAQDKNEQKTKPILWQSLEKFITMYSNLDTVSEKSDSKNNHRIDEIKNLLFILENILEYSIKGKWNPDNSESEHHKLARTYYYKTAFNNWHSILEKALRMAFDQKKGKAHEGALCYREEYDEEIKERFSTIIKKLFVHPLWVIENNQKEVATANVDNVVTKLFEKEGLDYIYLVDL